MKKMLLLLLGGIVLMSTVTGCSTTNSDMNKTKVQELFADFTNMFPTKNLEILYDKLGNIANLDKNDLGTWVISTHLYTSDDSVKYMGLDASFDRNTKKCEGAFYITYLVDGNEINEELPISYSNGFFFLVEVPTTEVKVAFENFKTLFEILDLDDNYFSSLEVRSFSYNDNVPLYGIDYLLYKDDTIIKQVITQYPDIYIDEKSLSLSLEGTGQTWNTGCRQSLRLFFDNTETNYITANIGFSRSSDIIDEE